MIGGMIVGGILGNVLSKEHKTSMTVVGIIVGGTANTIIDYMFVRDALRVAAQTGQLQPGIAPQSNSVEMPSDGYAYNGGNGMKGFSL